MGLSSVPFARTSKVKHSNMASSVISKSSICKAAVPVCKPRSSARVSIANVQLKNSRFSAARFSTRAPVRAGRFTVSAAADTETVDKVRDIISQQLGTDLDKVAADAKFVDLGADSLDTVEIMMALEETFSITLDEEGAEKISTVQEAADLIAAQVAAK